MHTVPLDSGDKRSISSDKNRPLGKGHRQIKRVIDGLVEIERQCQGGGSVVAGREHLNGNGLDAG